MPEVRMDFHLDFTKLTERGYIPRGERRLRTPVFGRIFQRQAAMRRLREVYLRALRRAVPVGGGPNYALHGRVGGSLVDSIRVVVNQRTGLVATADTPYALYVLAGVRQQPMVWLAGKTVRFWGARTGTIVIRTVTNVGSLNAQGRPAWTTPGMAARNFFMDAWDDPEVVAERQELLRLGIHAVAFSTTLPRR